VLGGAKELEELALGSTGLTGALSCDLALPGLEVSGSKGKCLVLQNKHHDGRGSCTRQCLHGAWVDV
jgi:hypothetical protein